MSPQPGKAPQRATGRRLRRHARYRAEFPVAVTLFSGKEHRKLAGHCRDLSQAGIGVLIAEELKLGEVASLVFSLPGTSHEWEVQAVLRHRRGYHYGFEFLSLSRERAEALAGYVEGLQRADFD